MDAEKCLGILARVEAVAVVDGARLAGAGEEEEEEEEEEETVFMAGVHHGGSSSSRPPVLTVTSWIRTWEIRICWITFSKYRDLDFSPVAFLAAFQFSFVHYNFLVLFVPTRIPSVFSSRLQALTTLFVFFFLFERYISF